MHLNLKCLSVGWCLATIAPSLSLAAASDLRVIQAVTNNDTQLIRRLLKQHADVNAAQGDGATALHWAAHLDNLAAADLLIRAGARVNAALTMGLRRSTWRA